MTATATVAGGLLVILGNSGDDYVSVVQDELTGLTVVIGETTQQGPWDAVQSIYIDLGAGENGVDLTVLDLPAIVDTGRGVDLVNVFNGNPDNAVSISTGGGNDFIHVDDTGTSGTQVFAGAGNDFVRFRQSSTDAARPSTANGGNGDDDFEGPGEGSADDPVAPYNPGVGFTHFHGGDGSDEFLAFNVNTFVRGGSRDDDGYDVATFLLDSLRPVTALRVEELIVQDVVDPIETA